MKFTSKQIVTMVVAGCAAVVLAPVTVFAATGQLVNVVDKVTGQSARVSTNGALYVEGRAYTGLNAFAVRGSRFGFGWIPLASTVGPTRLAITKIVMSGQYDAGKVGEVLIEAFTRTSGSQPCNGPGTSGYERHTIMHAWVSSRDNAVLDFAGQALPVPAAATGQPNCFGITYYAGDTNMTIYANAVGYKYRLPA